MEVSYSRLHNWHHDDYDLVKEHIHRQIGDLSQNRLFGRQVLCAIYIRPQRNPKTGIEYTDKAQAEDIAQGKTMLILQTGPSAFTGDPELLQEMYGPEGPPQIGDWVFARANVGESMHICLDGAEIVTYRDRRDEERNSYCFERGWPCRVLTDNTLIGQTAKPHQVV
jgi:hypothetical protein